MRILPVYSEPSLRPITIIRALQWIAVVVTGMSRSMPWGDEVAIGKGPPSQWERHVVGATLLLVIAALAISMTARHKKKASTPSRPGSVALAISALCCLSSLAVTMSVRSSAIDRGLSHVLLGGGWLWMLAGGAIALASTGGALFLRWQPPATR